MGCGSSLAGQVREGESLARACTGTEPAARVTVVLSYWVRQLIACDSKSCLAVAAVGRRGTAKLLQCWLLCSPTNHCALHHLGKPRAWLPARTSLWAGASSVGRCFLCGQVLPLWAGASSQLWGLHALQQALTLSCSSAEHLSPLCVCLYVRACVHTVCKLRIHTWLMPKVTTVQVLGQCDSLTLSPVVG